MSDRFNHTKESVAWVADTGLFIACGRQQNDKYSGLEQFAQRNNLTFVIPQRVYEELGGAPDRSTPGQTPINSAIEASWVEVAEEPDYSNSTVSQVMDNVRSFIASSSNRDEDTIEKADTALAAVAVEQLQDTARSVCIVTTDIDAGKGCVKALEKQGFEGRVNFCNGFDMIEEIT